VLQAVYPNLGAARNKPWWLALAQKLNNKVNGRGVNCESGEHCQGTFPSGEHCQGYCQTVII